MATALQKNSGAHSSPSQGGVERARRTQFGQVRTPKAQIRQTSHPLMPLIVRHKYNQQLLDGVHTGPWQTTLTTPVAIPLASKATKSRKDAATSTTAEGERQSTTHQSEQQTKQQKTIEPTLPITSTSEEASTTSTMVYITYKRTRRHNSRRKHRQATMDYSRKTSTEATYDSRSAKRWNEDQRHQVYNTR